MIRKTTLRSLISVLAVAAAVMTVGLSAAPANASVGPMTAKLSISANQSGYSTVTVSGVVKMSQSEAQSLIAGNHKIQWRLWGEDTFSDDFLYGPDPAGMVSTSKGLEFKGQAVMRNSVLNEDWGFDEVYAGVRLLKPNGSTLRSAQSNTVLGDF